MSEQIINLNKKRKNKLSIDQLAELFLDKKTPNLKEPEGLASGGDMSKILELEEDKDEQH
jgi:hypothetical protein